MKSEIIKCGICNEAESRYKCPKCGIRYCSLSCFKNEEKHKHIETATPEEKDNIGGASEGMKPSKVGMERAVLKNDELNQIYQETPELQELLQYNTVKFHLAKVYKILNSNTTDGDSNMNTCLLYTSRCV